ncbi:MAG: CvpA family protein [Alphaproteobacteria bacterium]
MTVTDIAVFGVVLVSALLALARGVVRELFTVAGWVGAIVATVYGFHHAQPFAQRVIANPLLADLAAGVVIFVVTLVVVSLLSRWVSDRVKRSQLNALDRSLGFLFGLARGAMLVCIAYLLLVWALPPKEHPGWVREARVMPVVAYGARALMTLLQREFRPGDIGERAPLVPVPGGALDAERLFREFTSPPPAVERARKEGYSDIDRKAFERLLETTQ